jgi:hypothetical protein
LVCSDGVFCQDDGTTPIQSHSCGVTIDTKSGGVYKHHIALGAVTPGCPGVAEFSAAQKMTPEERLDAYKVGAARQKYDPSHGPREGITKVVIEGGDTLYTTPVGGVSPMSVLIKSNMHLNKTDASGEPILHTIAGVKHHVLEQDSFDQAIDVLNQHLKPDVNNGGIHFVLHTPDPPSHPYSVTVHGHIERGAFVAADGVPAEPEAFVVPGTMSTGFGEDDDTSEVPGMPGMKGKFQLMALEEGSD